MFTATYAGEVLHDPRDGARTALDQSCSTSLTDAGSYTFTLPATHPLAGRLDVMSRSREVALLDDGEEVFRGRVRRMPEQSFEGSWTYECEGERAYLNDVSLPPYACGAEAPSTADALFSWYVARYNAKVPEEDRFHVGENDGWRLCTDELAISSESRPSVWDEMKARLLDVYGGFVRVRHENGRRWLDWLSDGTRECSQRVEFGVNLTDYALERDGTSLFTRVVPWAKREAAAAEDEGGEAGDGSELRVCRQPVDAWVEPGGEASFSVRAAGGTGTLSYAWQRSADGAKWAACGDSDGTGYDSTTFKPATGEDADGAMFRCAVSDEAGAAAASDRATLHVVEHPSWFGIDGAADRPLLEGYEKLGDAVVDVAAEAAHGVVERAVRYDADDAEALVSMGLRDLRNAAVAETLRISAVDLHRVDPAVERIALGDLVRVVSEPHGFDAYMLCSALDVDPGDATATYTLGSSSYSLTDAQGERIRELNAAVGAQAEAVTGARLAAERAGHAATSSAEAAERAEKASQGSVVGTSYEYATSADRSEAPSSGWSATPPEYRAGTYVWQRVTVTHGDGTAEETAPVLITGNDGTGIWSTVTAYAAGDSGTEPPADGWSASPQEPGAGTYLWTRNTVTYTDGSTSRGYSVARSGADAAVVELTTGSGSVLRNSRGSTTVRAAVVSGGERATDAASLRALLGDSARLAWREMGAGGAESEIAEDDPRLSDGGFTVSVGAADVEGEKTFTCDLVTD